MRELEAIRRQLQEKRKEMSRIADSRGAMPRRPSPPSQPAPHAPEASTSSAGGYWDEESTAPKIRQNFAPKKPDASKSAKVPAKKKAGKAKRK